MQNQILYQSANWILCECDSIYPTSGLKQNLGLDLYFVHLNFPPLAHCCIPRFTLLNMFTLIHTLNWPRPWDFKLVTISGKLVSKILYSCELFRYISLSFVIDDSDHWHLNSDWLQHLFLLRFQNPLTSFAGSLFFLSKYAFFCRPSISVGSTSKKRKKHWESSTKQNLNFPHAKYFVETFISYNILIFNQIWGLHIICNIEMMLNIWEDRHRLPANTTQFYIRDPNIFGFWCPWEVLEPVSPDMDSLQSLQSESKHTSILWFQNV